jgi:transcriptional regulator with XRE-family HTH domain
VSASPEQTSNSLKRRSHAGAQIDRREYERELLYSEVVEQLRAIAKDLKLSQHELARRLEVSDARLSHVMSGRANLTLGTIADLGWATGMRFALVAVPFTDRDDTPAAHDPPPPRWLESHVQLLAKRVNDALRRGR